MVARAWGAVLNGIEALPVQVEVDVANGLPATNLVGLPDPTVREARERVKAAIGQSELEYPKTRITVNLAPSDVRKHGAGLDLAMALAILGAENEKLAAGLEGKLIFGELSLTGRVYGVRGALQAAEAARAQGLSLVVCPESNASEASLAGVPVIGVATLREAVDVVHGKVQVDPTTCDPVELLARPVAPDLDLGCVRDQDHAKRAFEIAATGGHNLLLSGPPGSGKTLLARVLPSILPRLSLSEALEVTRIHSAAGMLLDGEALIRVRPFRSPHHGVSMVGMIGGGSTQVRPGEVTLSHRGVLFMDEFPEFPRSVLESLRQPVEDGVITVTRAKGATLFPARFMLIAAMNPCPCGMWGSDAPCKCTPTQFLNYQRRMSGPLLDRIDMHVTVGRVDTSSLLTDVEGDSSGSVRSRVESARAFAAPRFDTWGGASNAELPSRALLAVCALDDGARIVLERASHRYRLSARAVHRLLRVARTIADLAQREHVAKEDMFEAVTYRIVASDEEHA